MNADLSADEDFLQPFEDLRDGLVILHTPINLTLTLPTLALAGAWLGSMLTSGIGLMRWEAA